MPAKATRFSAAMPLPAVKNCTKRGGRFLRGGPRAPPGVAGAGANCNASIRDEIRSFRG